VVGGLLWDLVYPLIDAILILELWRAAEIIVAVQTARFADETTVPHSFLVMGRCFIAVDFAVQIIADCIRAQDPWGNSRDGTTVGPWR
jgi:hypothetical protein